MSDYATKKYLKNATVVDTWSFAKNTDGKNIDELKNVPSGLSSFKSKLDQLDIHKLKNVSSEVDQLDIDKLKSVPRRLSSFKSKVNKLKNVPGKVNKLHIDKLDIKLDDL